MVDTILIDGHDVRALAGCSVVGYIDGILAPGERRGEDDPLPGADGELLAALPLAAYIITIPLLIVGASRAERNANRDNLVDLITGWGNNGLVDLERRRDKIGGGYTPGTAPGRFLTGLSIETVNPKTGRTSLKYKQGAGFWLNGVTASL